MMNWLNEKEFIFLPDGTIRRTFPLNNAMEIFVAEGDVVHPDTLIATNVEEGEVRAINIASLLEIDPKTVKNVVRINRGDEIKPGNVIAESRGFARLWGKLVTSKLSGTIEYISDYSGYVFIREDEKEEKIQSFIEGRVVSAGTDSIVLEGRGEVVDGTFGLDGLCYGKIAFIKNILYGFKVTEPTIVVYPGMMTFEYLQILKEGKIKGLVTHTIDSVDLKFYLDHEAPFPLMILSGFGQEFGGEEKMTVFKKYEGKMAVLESRFRFGKNNYRPRIVLYGE